MSTFGSVADVIKCFTVIVNTDLLFHVKTPDLTVSISIMKLLKQKRFLGALKHSSLVRIIDFVFGPISLDLHRGDG